MGADGRDGHDCAAQGQKQGWEPSAELKPYYENLMVFHAAVMLRRIETRKSVTQIRFTAGITGLIRSACPPLDRNRDGPEPNEVYRRGD